MSALLFRAPFVKKESNCDEIMARGQNAEQKKGTSTAEMLNLLYPVSSAAPMRCEMCLRAWQNDFFQELKASKLLPLRSLTCSA